ncbi:MAG: glycosyltransferase [bacterium]|nr:glycosyltransferase [bacterium]
MKKVLLLCYYFPPMGMGGTQRSAKFVKYLPQFNWEPIVITVKNVRYYAHDNSLLQEIGDPKIIRTESLDPLRLSAWLNRTKALEKPHSPSDTRKGILNILNRIISGWLLIPDSKILWLPFAIYQAIKIINKNHIQVIYTTSPPHSAHIGGMAIKLITGVKWIADFRDDWTGGESQSSPTLLHTFINRLLEKFVLKYADQVIGMCEHLTTNLFNKSGTIEMRGKFTTIMNGYDPEDFSDLLNFSPNACFTITHCGSISKVSDPEPFLKAMQNLFQNYPELTNKIQVQFIGMDIFSRLQELVTNLELKPYIKPIRYLPHREALKEVMRSHLLLLTIFKKTDEEIITGKLFEYLASGKPILLISSEGEVARIVRKLKQGSVVPNDDIPRIQQAILEYLQKFKKSELSFDRPLSVPQFDRKRQTQQLAEIFDKRI